MCFGRLLITQMATTPKLVSKTHALKAITSSHMKVLEFVYEMVADVCLSETDKAVHTALRCILHGA